MINKYISSYEEIHEQMGVVATEIIGSGIKYSVLQGLPRGGLIPSVILHHILTARNYNIEYFNSPVHIYKVLPNILIVDDVYDTGCTANKHITSMKKLFQSIQIGFVFVHRKIPYMPIDNVHYFSSIVIPTNTWIAYPWEVDGSSVG